MHPTGILSCVFYRPQRSCEGYVFTGVCLSTGGVVSQHALQVVSQHALQQVSTGGLFPGGACSGGCLLWAGACSMGGAAPGGCLLQGGGDPSPPSRRLLLRTVRILLECILVFQCVYFSSIRWRTMARSKRDSEIEVDPVWTLRVFLTYV